MVKKVSNNSLKENFVFKYLRFSCTDVKKTIDFYQCIGMTLDWQLKHATKPETPAENKNKPPIAPGTLPAGQEPSSNFHYSFKNGNNPSQPSNDFKKFDDPKYSVDSTSEVPANTLPEIKTIFSLSFKTAGSEVVDGVHLIFEYTHPPPEEPVVEDSSSRKSVVSKKSVVSAGDASNSVVGLGIRSGVTESKKVAATTTAAAPEVKKSTRSSEYLVIYAKSLYRIVKRLQVKGFEIILPMTEFHEMNMAILKDPSDVEVRLIELTDVQHDELNSAAAAAPTTLSAQPTGTNPLTPHATNQTAAGGAPIIKRQWFMRVGYYAIPTNEAETTVKFYEKAFAHAPVVQNAGKKGTGAPDLKLKLTEKKKKGHDSFISNLQGFHVIDYEEYLYGLSKARHFWLGNEPRFVGSALCFIEKSHIDGLVRPIDRSDSKLICVGLEVNNLDMQIRKLELDKTNADMLWDRNRIRIQGIGNYARLRDQNNNLWVELFMNRPTDQTELIKEIEKETKVNKTLIKRPAATDVQYNFEIDTSYLMGQATRYLSEAAIHAIPISTEKAESGNEKSSVDESGDGSKPQRKTIKIKMQKKVTTDEEDLEVAFARKREEFKKKGLPPIPKSFVRKVRLDEKGKPLPPRALDRAKSFKDVRKE